MTAGYRASQLGREIGRNNRFLKEKAVVKIIAKCIKEGRRKQNVLKKE